MYLVYILSLIRKIRNFLISLKASSSLFLFSLLILLISNPVWAYVDPGSGSAIVTTILGLFAAIGYSFRKAFYRIKRKFFPKKDDKEKDREDKDIDDKNSK